jgi:hypothetical protein
LDYENMLNVDIKPAWLDLYCLKMSVKVRVMINKKT